jgi:ABC-2 type transport system ATP-binding protein
LIRKQYSTSVKDENSPYAIKVRDLRKKYGELNAIDGISFEAYPHEIFGFLGSNGAGKTTTIKCIMTLTKPSEGSIEVFGINALTDPDRVRQNIGYVPQSLSLVSELSGYENLLIYSKLYGVPKDKRNKNISHILELLGISERADDEVRKYSGGMMRRLEIGTAIVHNPPLIILDEPTIGLDPKGRHTVWDVLRRLVHELGTTIFMTTHDMSEADELCDRIAMINHGKISVIDTPSNLKRSVVGQEGEGQVVTIKTLDPAVTVSVLDREMGIKAQVTDNRSLRILMKDVESSFSALITTLVRAGIEVESINVQKPTLDDVFLKYAGTRTNEAESQEEGWKNIRDVRRTFRQMG